MNTVKELCKGKSWSYRHEIEMLSMVEQTELEELKELLRYASKALLYFALIHHAQSWRMFYTAPDLAKFEGKFRECGGVKAFASDEFILWSSGD